MLPKVRTKICGITRTEDAQLAADSGADAIGMVFYEFSPRSITLDVACDIARTVGPFVTTVALFVNAEPSRVSEVIERVNPHLLQFHGDETPDYCNQFGHPYIKAIRVADDTNIESECHGFDAASGLLFDAWTADQFGGTGKTFNWDRLKGLAGVPFVLAGGLTPGNVSEAIAQTSPYGVDVSSGVELAPGIKDPLKVRNFIMAVAQARR